MNQDVYPHWYYIDEIDRLKRKIQDMEIRHAQEIGAIKALNDSLVNTVIRVKQTEPPAPMYITGWDLANGPDMGVMVEMPKDDK